MFIITVSIISSEINPHNPIKSLDKSSFGLCERVRKRTSKLHKKPPKMMFL